MIIGDWLIATLNTNGKMGEIQPMTKKITFILFGIYERQKVKSRWRHGGRSDEAAEEESMPSSFLRKFCFLFYWGSFHCATETFLRKKTKKKPVGTPYIILYFSLKVSYLKQLLFKFIDVKSKLSKRPNELLLNSAIKVS